MLKKKPFKPDDNPERQKLNLKQALKHINEKDSLFSDMQSVMTIVEKYGQNDSFFER